MTIGIGIKRKLAYGFLFSMIGFSAINFGISRIGREVYKGTIDGREVVYEEKRFNAAAGGVTFLKNRMTVKEGDHTYIFDDIDGETNIDSPEFENQRLEHVSIMDETGTESFTSKNEYGEGLEDQHTETVFKRADNLYNSLRAEIRKNIEAAHREKEEQIPQPD